MASGLSGRVAAIRAAIALIGHLSGRLRYLQPEVRELVAEAVELASLGENRFLPLCHGAMERGAPFPEAWRSAVLAEPGALGKEESAALSGLGSVLGSTDLAGQLAALDSARAGLEACLAEALDRRDKHQKLYSTLGVLAGAAIVILLI